MFSFVPMVPCSFNMDGELEDRESFKTSELWHGGQKEVMLGGPQTKENPQMPPLVKAKLSAGLQLTMNHH